jgi:hypothetical protein
VRIIVTGYIVRHPLGGMVWSNLQYLLGLKNLGHDVFFVEDSEDYPDCYDPARNALDTDPGYGIAFAQRTLAGIGFEARWAYYDAHTARWLGPRAEDIVRTCEGADLLLNLCGVNPLRPWLADIPRKVLVDEDPAFTQVRNIHDADRLRYVNRHDVFFTFAQNIGSASCRVPDDGVPWIPTRQPVVLDALAPESPSPAAPFTTVMYWQSTKAPEHEGLVYGMKAESFSRFVSLPARSSERFELAIGGATAPLQWLRDHGWGTADSRTVTLSVPTYVDYIRGSKAELSVAKHGYVVSRCGWFSERSTTYMALGRPVVVQNTGFTEWLPCGEGVLAFDSIDEAVDAVANVAGRYDRHCRAARELVEQYFDSRSVLTCLLETACRRPGDTRPGCFTR